MTILDRITRTHRHQGTPATPTRGTAVENARTSENSSGEWRTVLRSPVPGAAVDTTENGERSLENGEPIMENVENGRRENENQDHRPAHAATENVPRSRENGERGTENATAGPKIPRMIVIGATGGVAVLTVVVAIMASVGQVDFAKAVGAVDMIGVGNFDATPWFAPAVFDLAVIVLLNLGMYFVYHDQSPWPAWAVAGAVGIFSVWTNTQHPGAKVFAPASAVLLLIYFIRLYYKYSQMEQGKKRRATTRPKVLTTMLAVTSLRVARRAWLITIRRPEVDTYKRAVELAETWIDVFDDVCARKDHRLPRLGKWTKPNKRLARRTAWRLVAVECGISVITLEGIQLATVTYAAPPPKPIPAPQPPARPAITATPNQRPAAPRPPAAVPVSPAPAGPTTPAWAPIAAIPGLEHADLDGELDHRVAKNGDYILQVVTYLAAQDPAEDAWNRTEPIRPKDVRNACAAINSGGSSQRVADVMNDIRVSVFGTAGKEVTRP
jgi:hypothetical protein